MRLALWFLLLCYPGVALTARAQKDVAGCKAVLDATLKTASTPHHAVSTQARAGQNRVAESILVNDKSYIQIQGHWRESPITPAEMAKQERENIDSAKVYTCHAIRNEAGATVYQVHSENDIVKSDGEVWVAKGLVQRVDEDVDTGDVSSKMHVSTKYDYANIKAPPGV